MDSARKIRALVHSLGSRDRHERAQAAIELGQRKAKTALRDLSSLVDDDEPVVSLAAMYACWELGEDRVSVDRILSAFKSDDEGLVQQAVETVCAIGGSLVARLTPWLNREPDEVMLVLRILSEIGGDEALGAVRSVRPDDEGVRELIEEILEEWEDG